MSNQVSNRDRYIERTNWNKYVEQSFPRDSSRSDHEKLEELIEKVHYLERKLSTEDPDIENDVIAKSPNSAADQVKSPETLQEKSPVKSQEEYVRPDYMPVSKCPELTEAVDAVYTWVNGSDPEFVNSLKETDLGLKTHKDDTHNQRFAGKLFSIFLSHFSDF